MNTTDLAWMAWTQAWQLAALIAVVAAVVWVAAKRRPHLAHVLWLVVLAKCLTPPLMTSPGGIFCWLQPQRPVGSPLPPQSFNASRPLQLSTVADPVAGEMPDMGRARAETPAEITFQTGETTVGVPLSAAVHFVDELSDGSPPRQHTSAAAAGDRFSTSSRRLEGVLPWLAGLWLAGSAGYLILAVVRWRLCLHRIRRSRAEFRPDLEALVVELSQRLKLRRRVRLIVTSSKFGPAVVGLRRPTILLPSVVVSGKAARELEPIVAHELIHVRRGDLWIGMGQIAAQALWWFHPLVRIANRLATRAAEACCDEEVIAELKCDPDRYARSLLEVLQLQRGLLSVPAFPGMRPVDVTRQRLERIMSLGQGCRMRTPWWCWIVMLLAAAGTLPGAAFVVSAGDENNPQPADQKGRPNAFTEGEGELTVQPPITGARRAVSEPTDAPDGQPGPAGDESDRSAESAKYIGDFVDEGDGLDLYVRSELRSVRMTSTIATRINNRFQADSADKSKKIATMMTDRRIALAVPSRYENNAAHFAQVVRRIVLDETAGERRERLTRIRRLLMVPSTAGQSAIELEAIGPDGVPILREGLKSSDAEIRYESAGALAFLEDGAGTVPRTALTGSGVKQREQLRIDLRSDDAPPDIELALIAVADEIVDTAKESDGALPARRTIELRKNVCLWLHDRTFKANGERAVIVVELSDAPGRRIESLTVKVSNGQWVSAGVDAIAGELQARFQPFGRRSASIPCLRDIEMQGRARLNAGDYQAQADSIFVAFPQSEASPAPGGPGNANVAPERMHLVGNASLLHLRPYNHGTTDSILQADRIEFDLASNLLKATGAFRYEGEGRQRLIVTDGTTRDDPKEGRDGQARVRGANSKLAQVKEDALITVNYSVADLVVPVRHLYASISSDVGTAISSDGQREKNINRVKAEDPKVQADFTALMNLIETTIAPDSWEGLSGPGSMMPYQTTLSLVIRQKQNVHDEIADLLSVLRRLQDLQVVLQVNVLTVADASFKALPVDLDSIRRDSVSCLTEDQAKRVRELAEKSDGAAPTSSAKMILCNGQGAELKLRRRLLKSANGTMPLPPLQFVPTISADRTGLRLKVAVGAKQPLDALARGREFVIKQGQSLLADITADLDAREIPGLPGIPAEALRRQRKAAPSESVLLLITARVIVQEEEEVINRRLPQP